MPIDVPLDRGVHAMNIVTEPLDEMDATGASSTTSVSVTW